MYNGHPSAIDQRTILFAALAREVLAAQPTVMSHPSLDLFLSRADQRQRRAEDNSSEHVA